MFTIRPADARGKTSAGWLTSYHSFSFNRYYDPAHVHFGPLLVLNEDRVIAGGGFPAHPHDNMEIVTWVLEGAVEHQDSMGTRSVIREDEVQRMTAGTGVFHSEYNPSQTDPLHFLQIWFLPEEAGLEPSYEQRAFPPDARRNVLQPVASGRRDLDAVFVHQDVTMYVSLLEQESRLHVDISPKRGVYVFLVDGILKINGLALSAGDALMVEEEPSIDIESEADADVVLFDLPMIYRSPRRV